VVIHDSTLDRTSDATNRWGGKGIKVSAHPIAELKTLDVGRWFGAAFAGQRLPELAEAIDEIQRGSVTLIERKAGDAATCVALVRGKGLLNHVVVQSFDWEYLRDYRAREPEQILAALGPPGSWEGRKLEDAEKELDAEWCERVKSLGVQVVAWNRQVDAAAVRAAHRRGLKVWVYTINDEETAHRLLDASVDGIITDKPTMLRKVLAARSR
jgi:glycerophosphoryl diester phosphodiesterase